MRLNSVHGCARRCSSPASLSPWHPRSRPYGTWRWGGPQWTERTGSGAPGRLAGITVAVADPLAVASRWAQVLGVPLADGDRAALRLDGGEVSFLAVDDESAEGLVEIAIEDSPSLEAQQQVVELGGVRLRSVARV